jgi:FMN-dependent NADH-azoreductase
MPLLEINGSPRGRGSNTRLLLEAFNRGLVEAGGAEPDTLYLASRRVREEAPEKLKEYDTIFLAFPLYTDAMPGIVKEFLDSLKGKEICRGKTVLYLVQSGFPESIHSRYVTRYLGKLTERLGMKTPGVIIRGGVEGIQVMPPRWTKNLFREFHDLGRIYHEKGILDPGIRKKLARPERLGPGRRLFYRIGICTGLANYYWNMKLKVHNAFEKRFDRPYEPDN